MNCKKCGRKMERLEFLDNYNKWGNSLHLHYICERCGTFIEKTFEEAEEDEEIRLKPFPIHVK